MFFVSSYLTPQQRHKIADFSVSSLFIKVVVGRILVLGKMWQMGPGRWENIEMLFPRFPSIVAQVVFLISSFAFVFFGYRHNYVFPILPTVSASDGLCLNSEAESCPAEGGH